MNPLKILILFSFCWDFLVNSRINLKKIIPFFSKCMSHYRPHLTGLTVTLRTMLNKHCPVPSVFFPDIKEIKFWYHLFCLVVWFVP